MVIIVGVFVRTTVQQYGSHGVNSMYKAGCRHGRSTQSNKQTESHSNKSLDRPHKNLSEKGGTILAANRGSSAERVLRPRWLGTRQSQEDPTPVSQGSVVVII